MTVSLHDLEQQLAQLSRPEKAQLVQALVLDLAHPWPGIEQTPGVVGGDACIVRTRIPVFCTRDIDADGQAARIHDALAFAGELAGKLIRVNRPGS